MLTQFMVGQRVICKSATSMAVQFIKIKRGEEFVIINVEYDKHSQLLSLEAGDRRLHGGKAVFPSDDFELVQNAT